MNDINKKKVLLIDDEEDLCNFTKLYLDNTGLFETRTLTDSREVLKVGREFRPDIIILDLRMPHIGGFEILELFNKDEGFRKTPVIVTTALSDRADIKKAFFMGASGYIAKPFEFPELTKEIEKALNE